ncbi:ComF family protein [Photobacterium leiognathi]|uniref:ComF family protein n=1 Tax=Photobacterium leiognathi TaxID=553611 RepID=UPI0029811CE8|nr:ComF family protein [Photobacterium leiognathi]
MMPKNITAWLSRTSRKLLFRHCSLCQLPLEPNDDYWCQHCLNHFPSSPYCHRCGTSTFQNVEYCGLCLAEPPPWHRLYRLGEYQPPLQQLISQYKFGKKFWLAKPLARQLAKQIAEPASLLLPVPLHRRRYWQRGFNQSHYLALVLAKELGSDVNHHVLKRHRHTPAQKALTKQQRKSNLANAFSIQDIALPEHVAIVDDVVTTGTTVSLLTQLLLRKGVKKVDIIAVCHTEKPM